MAAGFTGAAAASGQQAQAGVVGCAALGAADLVAGSCGSPGHVSSPVASPSIAGCYALLGLPARRHPIQGPFGASGIAALLRADIGKFAQVG